MNYTCGWRKIFEAEVKNFVKLTFPCNAQDFSMKV